MCSLRQKQEETWHGRKGSTVTTEDSVMRPQVKESWLAANSELLRRSRKTTSSPTASQGNTAQPCGLRDDSAVVATGLLSSRGLRAQLCGFQSSSFHVSLYSSHRKLTLGSRKTFQSSHNILTLEMPPPRCSSLHQRSWVLYVLSGKLHLMSTSSGMVSKVLSSEPCQLYEDM